MDSRAYQSAYFILCGLFSLSVFGRRRHCHSKSVLFPCLVVGSLFLWSIYSVIPLNNPTTFFQLINILIGVGLVFQIANEWTIQMSSIIKNAFSVSCLLSSLWVILQQYELEPLKYIYNFDFTHIVVNDSVSGPLHNRMVTASFIAPLIPFIFRKWWFYLTPVPVYALFLLNSSMGWLGLAVGCLYSFGTLGKFNAKQWCMVLMPLLCICSYLLWFSQSDSVHELFNSRGRYIVWKDSLIYQKLSPYGIGPGMFEKFRFEGIQGEIYRHAHSEYVMAWITWGSVGFCLLVLFYCLLLTKHKREPHYSASLVAGFAVAYGGFPFYIAPSALTLIVCTGALLNYADMDRQIAIFFQSFKYQRHLRPRRGERHQRRRAKDDRSTI